MKPTLPLFLAVLLTASVAHAQDFGFGGRQDADTPVPYAEKIADLNYAGDTMAYHTLDVYLPRTPKPRRGYPVAIHIYGSAWFSNSSKGVADIGTICAALLDAGFAVVCPNHRSSQDAPYPAQINDIKAVVRWVRGNASQYPFDGRHIVTSGFSSGAHLASLCAATNGITVAREGSAEYDIEGSLGNYTDQSSRVSACCEWSGPIDLMNMDCAGKRDMPFSPEQALMGFDYPGHEDAYALLSPIHYLSRRTVPILVCHGSEDNVVPSCQGEEFYLALQEHHVRHSAYNPVPGGGHGFNMYSPANLQRMVAFLTKYK